MSIIQDSLRASPRLSRYYWPWLEDEGDQSLESWITLIQRLGQASRASSNDVLVWILWERHGQEPLQGSFPFLLRSCQAIPAEVWRQTHEALFALAQTWPEARERAQLLYAMTEAALYRLHTQVDLRPKVPEPLLAKLRPHMDTLLKNLLAHIAGERDTISPVPVRAPWLSPACLLAWREELGEPALSHSQRRALLTWERQALGHSSPSITHRPELATLFHSFSKNEQIDMMRDGAGPVWLLASTPDRDVLRNFLTSYMQAKTVRQVENILREHSDLDWSDALVYNLPLMEEAQLIGLEKQLQGLPRMPQGQVLEMLARCSPVRTMLLQQWLCAQWTPEEVLDLWPGVAFEIQQVLARLLLQHALTHGEEGLFTRLEAVIHSTEEEQLLAATRAHCSPDWGKLTALPTPWLPEEEPTFVKVPLRALGGYWEENKKDRRVRSFLARQVSCSPYLMMTLVRSMTLDGQGWWGMAGILAQSQPRWYRGALEAVLLTHKVKVAKGLYDKAMTDNFALSDAVHLRVLREGTVTMQRHASRVLSEKGATHLEALCALLQSRKAGVRSAVARTLALIGDSKAEAPLREALEKEKSAKVKPLLRTALEACDPKMVRLKAQTRGGLGIYRLGDRLEPREGLEALRAILYEPATPVSWARLCDVLARMQALGMQSAALDYLSDEALARWPEAQRVLPWGWDKDPALARLGSVGEGDWTWWLPISVLCTPAREDFFDAVLPGLEHRARKRKLPRDQVSLWLRWVERAWFWCQDNDMALEVLEAQLDGGSYHGMSRPDTSCLKLVHGFAVCLTREPSYTGETAPEGIRWIRVPLPKGHLLRSKFRVDSYRAHLHLNEVLPLDP